MIKAWFCVSLIAMIVFTDVFKYVHVFKFVKNSKKKKIYTINMWDFFQKFHLNWFFKELLQKKPELITWSILYLFHQIYRYILIKWETLEIHGFKKRFPVSMSFFFNNLSSNIYSDNVFSHKRTLNRILFPCKQTISTIFSCTTLNNENFWQCF